MIYALGFSLYVLGFTSGLGLRVGSWFLLLMVPSATGLGLVG